jgi:hypothetical protein
LVKYLHFQLFGPSTEFFFCDLYSMYLEGPGKRFLFSAKSFDVGRYYISAYEGFPNVDSRPKCGYVARVERQRDGSFLVCLDYCHLCDQKLGKFCCGRSPIEREVVARVHHSVKRYKKVNMEFRCLSVTIPTISKSGTRKVWCPRSFRKVNPSIPNSADVTEALSCTPKMGMKLVSKLPEWNAEANNLVVRFQGSGRILVASAKNFLLYEQKYSTMDFAEQSLAHIDDRVASKVDSRGKPGVVGTAESGSGGQRGSYYDEQEDDVESGSATPKAAGGKKAVVSPTAAAAKAASAGAGGGARESSAELTNKNIAKLQRTNSEYTSAGGSVSGGGGGGEATEPVSGSNKVGGVSVEGDDASRSSRSRSGGREKSSSVSGGAQAQAQVQAGGGGRGRESTPRGAASEDGSVNSSTSNAGGGGGGKKLKKSSLKKKVADSGSNASNSPKSTPRTPRMGANGGGSGAAGAAKASKRETKDAGPYIHCVLSNCLIVRSSSSSPWFFF